MTAAANTFASKTTGIGYINEIKHWPAREAAEGRKAHDAYYSVKISIGAGRDSSGFKYLPVNVSTAPSLDSLFTALATMTKEELRKVKFSLEILNVCIDGTYTSKTTGAIGVNMKGYLVKCAEIEVEAKPQVEQAEPVGLTD